MVKMPNLAKGNAVEGSHENGVRVGSEGKKETLRTGTRSSKVILGPFLPEFLIRSLLFRRGSLVRLSFAFCFLILKD